MSKILIGVLLSAYSIAFGSPNNDLVPSCLNEVKNSGEFVTPAHIRACALIKHENGISCLNIVGNSGSFLQPTIIITCSLVTTNNAVSCLDNSRSLIESDIILECSKLM